MPSIPLPVKAWIGRLLRKNILQTKSIEVNVAYNKIYLIWAGNVARMSISIKSNRLNTKEKLKSLLIFLVDVVVFVQHIFLLFYNSNVISIGFHMSSRYKVDCPLKIEVMCRFVTIKLLIPLCCYNKWTNLVYFRSTVYDNPMTVEKLVRFKFSLSLSTHYKSILIETKPLRIRTLLSISTR